LNIGYLMQEGVDIRRPPFNGPANHVREVVRGLEGRGHKVRMLVRVQGQIWRSDNLEDFQQVKVRWLDRGALRLLERGARRIQSELQLPYAAMFESFRFSQACVQELNDCDLFYERIGWVGYGAGLAAKRLHVPLVMEDNGDPLFDLEAKGMAPTGLQHRLSLTLMQHAVGRASHVVSSGAGWRDQFIKRWNYEPDKVTAIENGTNLVHVLKREQLRSFNEDQDTSPVTLVYLGGFYPWHGVPVLLKALAKARAQGAQANLLMIGSGSGFSDAQKLAAALNMNGAVNLMGHLESTEYAPLLAGAHVGVAPYCNWPEFSGLKVLDYKAAGLPTIASGRNGHPRTLRDGETGLIVPPCDTDALGHAIVQLCANGKLRKRMGQAARLDAEKMHGWEQTAERLEQVFLTVLTEAQRN
jgi:glycosyltransferase involved in cell wall biosynthesis